MTLPYSVWLYLTSATCEIRAQVSLMLNILKVATTKDIKRNQGKINQDKKREKWREGRGF